MKTLLHPRPEETTASRHPIPASFFGIILGLVGLGDCWCLAAIIWHVPPWIGEIIMLSATVIWILLLLLYIRKWVWARDEALAEFHHPIQCCFIGLVPVSTVLVALALAPYSRPIAVLLLVIGAVGQVGFGVYRTGRLWMGDRNPETTTAVLYLPTVAVYTIRLAPALRGTDSMAVVDSELRVYGVVGLRVFDAFIMLIITTRHTNAPTIEISEKAANLIKATGNVSQQVPSFIAE